MLLTNRSVREVRQAQGVFADWQRRSQIEHFYRFDQENGLRVESMQVASLERLRRLFLLVLLAAAFLSTIWSRLGQERPTAGSAEWEAIWVGGRRGTGPICRWRASAPS